MKCLNRIRDTLVNLGFEDTTVRYVKSGCAAPGDYVFTMGVCTRSIWAQLIWEAVENGCLPYVIEAILSVEV
jgi:hypothetical protein